MLFVYIGTVNETSQSYEIHIYDASQDLFPVAAQIESYSIPVIVDFLQKHHNGLDEKDKLKAKFKIQIHDDYDLATPAPNDPSKFITIFDMLNFYNAVSYESPSECKHFQAYRHLGSLGYLDRYGDRKEIWEGWDGGLWGMSQPKALLTLLELRGKTKAEDPTNTNIDNCIKVCKERIYESVSPRRNRYRKKAEG